MVKIMKKKVVAVLMAYLMCLSALAGCGKTDSGNGASEIGRASCRERV